MTRIYLSLIGQSPHKVSLEIEIHYFEQTKGYSFYKQQNTTFINNKLLVLLVVAYYQLSRAKLPSSWA